MKILAFDTCLDKTYITIANDKDILANKVILSDSENYHSAYLISTITELLKQTKLKPIDIDIIATDIGPGSFTGIRACTTVARVLAQQLNIKAIGKSSLEILSKIINEHNIVVLDARKNKGYVYDKEVLGAIEIEKIYEIVKGKTVITDNNLIERISLNAKKAISYQQIECKLSDILAQLAIKKQETDWRKLKPLYIQPPPVFGK